ncbi:hypothetical protein [Kineococcus glutinatus]|uniref:hypothetical protein n=1 Tax=Kineococcus glutinatus TaxID=1070872 RepID=UPI0031E777A5
MSPGQVLQLAEVVARPGERGMLLGRDNAPARDEQGRMFLSLVEAVASGMAFMVTPREGLVPLDGDADADGNLPGWYESARSFCERLGCELVEMTSGSARGSRHLWVVTPVGWTNADFAQRLRLEVPSIPDRQVRHGSRMRPPLSIHREGGRGDLLGGLTIPEVLETLSTRPGRCDLTERTQQRMREGDETMTRDRLATSLALAYVNADEPLQRFADDMLNPANLAGAKVQALPQSKRWAYLERKYVAAQRFAQEHPPVAGMARQRELEYLRATAPVYPFTGRERVPRAAFAYLVGLALEYQRLEVACSVRQLADALGTSRKSATKALATLRHRHGLVQLLEEGHNERGSLWRLRPEQVRKVVTQIPGGERCITSGHLSPAFTSSGLHPVFGGPGLPLGAGLLWQAMDPQVQRYTVTELLERVPCLSRETVREYLHRLHDAGLARVNKERGHYWTRIDQPTKYLNALAERYGSTERRQQRHAQFALERALYGREGRVEQAPKRRCSAVRPDGTPCQSWAQATGPRTRAEFCQVHGDEQQRAAARAWKDAQANPGQLPQAA